MFEQRPEGGEEMSCVATWGQVFQAGGTASAKTLWQEPAGYVPGTSRGARVGGEEGEGSQRG